MAPRKLDAQRALRMRTAGVPYEKIAGELNLSMPKAYQAVIAGLEDQRAEANEVTTRLELERLDAMLVGLWKSVTRGDPKAVEQALKVSERRAALLADIAPTPAEAEPGDDSEGGTLGDYLAEIKRSAKDQAAPTATVHPISEARA